jgi:hypothetical protein
MIISSLFADVIHVTLSNDLEILNEAKQYSTSEEYFSWLTHSLKRLE